MSATAFSINNSGVQRAKNVLLNYISQNQIQTLINIAMSKGADMADVYIERSETHSIGLDEKVVKSGNYGVGLGVGIRAVKGQEVGYAYSDDLNFDRLKRTAEVSASIAAGHHVDMKQILQEQTIPNRYPNSQANQLANFKDKIALLKRGEQKAYAYDKRIIQVNASVVNQMKHIAIANSDGFLFFDERPMVRMSFFVLAKDGKERTSGSYGGGGRKSLDFFLTEGNTSEEYATEAARMAIAQMGAKACPAGPQTIVMSPGWSGILLHEAVGHGLEADFIAKKTSLYTGKINEQVAASCVSVIDNGTTENERGSLNIDDEGNVPQEKVLIENGILKDYMYDKISAKLLGKESNGAGRRQSYRHPPLPRMTSTYMRSGQYDHDEIVQSCEKGLYCASFGGGQVDITNGNFVFEVKEGYMIENGKLTTPVRGATLIGVGPEALKNVTMVGNDPKLDPGIGTCGKDGQSVPVNVGQPTIKMENITVGGTG